MNSNLTITEIAWGSEEYYHHEVPLRYAVLRQPLGLTFTPEQLAVENTQFHLAAWRGGELVGILLLQPHGAHQVQMRQVAVLPQLQGTGIGRLLVEESERFAKAKGFGLMVLHARDTAVPFYTRLGYTLIGDGFTEVTIPHHKMQKEL